ncbi:MAG TPA: PQQ-binding-like beta-propeller repeat protein [Pirellulales bacterium]|nr:PQQ-binding-like beta-propeller repeat protein [Pirellulales bacterium]
MRQPPERDPISRARTLALLAGGLWGLVLTTSSVVYAGDWPQFRGPDGQGHSSERGLPLEWSETQNVAWKQPLEGLGWSSPVISGGQVWLTTAIAEKGALKAVRLDAKTGQQISYFDIFHKDDLGPIHTKNSHASPTPVIEGDRIYVHFGAHGTACLSTSGEVLWRNQELAYDHRHGPAGSPVIWQDLLIVSCDGTDKQFVVALDKKTGEIRWRTDRSGRMAYSTPLVIHVDGGMQLVSPGGDQVVGYAPATGTEIWRFRYDGYSVVPRPVFGHGLVFVSSAYDSPVLYAIRLPGEGDITETAAAWSMRRGAPNNPSPVLVGDELYVVSDLGIATCVDAETGEQHWQSRLGGGFSASLLAAEGHIYFTNEEGLTTVVAADKTLNKLASNQLDGRTLASLATADGAIFLRTDKALYRIEAAK